MKSFRLFDHAAEYGLQPREYIAGGDVPIAQSSHLQSYDYDPDNQTLTIQFVNGSVYQYSNVPETVYWNLAQQGGAGSYFHAKIRNQYPTTLVFKP